MTHFLSALFVWCLLSSGVYAKGIDDRLSSKECDHLTEIKDACSADGSLVSYNSQKNVICVNGEFREGGKIYDEIKNLNIRLNPLLVINSSGGEISEAMDVAYFLKKYDYDIAITGTCVSACAQFVFVAARKKYICGNAVVAMHGGPLTPEQISQLPYTSGIKNTISLKMKRFVKFYRDNRVDLGLVKNAPKYILPLLKSGKTAFWIPTEDDYFRYGVRNVVYCNSKYRDPRKPKIE